MSELPANVLVGRYLYKVTDDAARWAQAGVDGIVRSQGFGASNHLTLEIILNPVQHPLQKADTLLHEVLHCVWHISNAASIDVIKDDNDVEEYVIGHLTARLVEILVANPGLVEYLGNPHED